MGKDYSGFLYKILDQPPPDPLPEILPATKLDTEDGFIHLSTAEQIPVTANLFFAHCDQLWVLELTVSALDGKLEYSTDPNAGIENGCAHLHGSQRALGFGNIEDVLTV